MSGPVIEVLGFDGCPHTGPALELVGRVCAELELDADVRFVEVPDPGTADRLRFLGSPTIRVDGCDIEPGAETRTVYVHSCRVYPGAAGLTGLPDERWLRTALPTRRSR